MFLNRKTKDCIDLLNENKCVIGIPYVNKFLAAANYSYPSHKDKDVMDRIFYQKKLIDENGMFEAILSLAKNTTFSNEYINYTGKLIQKTPRWSDEKNYSQSSTTFTLAGKSYTAEQHSSNFNSLVCLYRNKELIFGATLIGHQQGERDAIAIESSKLELEEIGLLVAFANLSEDMAKSKRNSSWNKLIEQQTAEYEDKISKNF